MSYRLPLLLCLLVLAAPARAEEEAAAPDLTTVEGVKAALASREVTLRLAGAREALLLQDKRLTAPLLKLLRDDEPPVREAAVAALAAREEEAEKKAAAKGIALLLLPLGREPDTIATDREKLLVPALHTLAQPVAMKALLEIHTLAPEELVKPRLLAVANIPDKAAIEALIAFASRGRRGNGQRARATSALQYATGVKLGNDPEKWRAWWRDAKDTFDAEAQAEARRATEAERAERERRKEERRNRRGEKRDGKEGGSEGEDAE